MAYRPPAPGHFIDGKYRLAERIGGGGMGDVFRADAAGRAVAMKFLHPEHTQNAEIAQRFLAEAQAVNRIRHPNIVEVLDVGNSDAGPYIVMELLEGESVGNALGRLGKFEPDAAVGVTVPVLEALDAAHRAGIIHRDLKPENVFLAQDARGAPIVRLLDFGIAKVLDTSGPGLSPRTRTGVVFGTPDYLSPEQATGDAPLDGRSDLFSVGVLLFELLTGVRPFRAPTAVATAFRVVHAEAPTLASTGIAADPRLEAIVAKLLQKEPAKRYASAADVSRELERAAEPSRRRDALLRVAIPAKRASFPSSSNEFQKWRASSPDLDRNSTGPTSATRLGLLSRAEPSSSPRPPPFERAKAPPPPPSSPSREPPPSARRTIVRPFPERFAGKYQVRGPVLRSLDRAIVDVFGASARDEIVAAMPEHLSQDLRQGAVNAMVAYDLEAIDVYLELATALVVKDVNRWRELGRHAVDGELQTVVRTLLRPSADLASVIRRGVTIWARLFSFGGWRVAAATERTRGGGAGDAKSGRVALQISELDAVSLALRLWLMGVVEQTARRAMGADVKVVVTHGELSFTPELSCEIG